MFLFGPAVPSPTVPPLTDSARIANAVNNNHPLLTPQQSQILRTLRSEGPLSRWQLHQRTALRPNTVGDQVGKLLRRGLVCETAAQSRGPGRPRVPLTVDTNTLHVVGTAIRPGHVEACRLNLCGQPRGRLRTRPVGEPSETIATVESLLREIVNDQTFLVGLSTTGFVDASQRRILLSSALPRQHLASLDTLFDVACRQPLVVENDMHALAARWLQEHHRHLDEDVLLVYLDDGELGAALLVRGEPNWGCLVGGNELGHTRLPVKTAPCYCGHTGCMERICSTEFLHRHGAASGTLLEQAAGFDGAQPAVVRMIELLATGLANSVNFIRPHRIVLVSPLTRHGRFMEALILAVRSRIMTTLADRVAFHYWDQAATGAGEAAGWLALAAIYYPSWTKAIMQGPGGERPE